MTIAEALKQKTVKQVAMANNRLTVTFEDGTILSTTAVSASLQVPQWPSFEIINERDSTAKEGV